MAPMQMLIFVILCLLSTVFALSTNYSSGLRTTPKRQILEKVDCTGDYFDFTVENRKASNFTGWFLEYDKNVDRKTKYYTKANSHVDYLIQQWLHYSRYTSCDIASDCKLPTCNEIYAATIANGGDKGLARKRFFVIKTLDNIRTFYQAAYVSGACFKSNFLIADGEKVSLLPLFGQIGGVVDEVAPILQSIPNLGDDQKCKLQAGLVKLGTNIAELATFGVVDLGLSPSNVAIAKFPMEYALAGTSTLSHVDPGAFSFIQGSDVEANICAVYHNERGSQKQIVVDAKLASEMDGMLSRIQEDLKESLMAVIHGDATGKNGDLGRSDLTKLAQLIQSGKFFDFDHLAKRLFDQSSNIQKFFRDNLVFQSLVGFLSSQQCFIHCTSEKVGRSDNRDVAASRIEPEPGVTCQAQCWRNRENTKNLPLYGMAALEKPQNPYGISLQEFLKFSYDAWKLNRYREPGEGFRLSMSDLLHENRTGERMANGGLPTCLSSMKPDDFQEKNNRDKVLPCICGDNNGNETIPFWDDMHLDQWVTYKKHMDDHPLIRVAQACQTSFTHLHSNPLQMFLTYCRLGTRFPIREGKLWNDNEVFGPTSDPNCDAFTTELADLEQRFIPFHNITCWMCDHSDVVKKIEEHQQLFWFHRDGSHWDNQEDKDTSYNVKAACDAYKKERKCGK